MNEEQLLQKIEEFIERNERNIVSDIAKLVSIKSVSGETPPKEGAPYGEGPRRALNAALDIAGGFGLCVSDGEGHMGWAELAGESKEYIATVTHLDVVPAGDGWSGDAFELRKKDGWLIGRGVLDDKAASVLCLYAAKFFAQQGLPLRYTLRILLGCSEETGMADAEYYVKTQKQPLFCFSPDAKFPLCNGEKGILQGRFISPLIKGNVVEFSAGQAPNVIAGRASCTVKAQDKKLGDAPNISCEVLKDGLVKITAQGRQGHAASPKGCVNAIGLLVEYLLRQELCSAEEREFFALTQKMHANFSGEGLGIACEDEMFGALSINGGVIKKRGDVFTQSVDIRYPTCTSAQKLSEALGRAAREHGCEYERITYDEPYYISADTPQVKALLSAYTKVSGQKGETFTMGGGTYARHFENAVSFGPAPASEQALPDFVGMEHCANEGALLKDLLQALKIYMLGIWRLQQTEF